jgi:hypothetical protein
LKKEYKSRLCEIPHLNPPRGGGLLKIFISLPREGREGFRELSGIGLFLQNQIYLQVLPLGEDYSLIIVFLLVLMRASPFRRG